MRQRVGQLSLDAHYPHRHNRSLVGDVDFVDVPGTCDPNHGCGGGAPQDLRVELVDAKNHWYTIHKAVKRQMAAGEACRSNISRQDAQHLRLQ